MLARTDILVCLLPLTQETRGVIDARALALLPPGAFLINGGRGGHQVQADLLAALDSGQVGGAAMDVGRAPDQMPTPSLAAHPKIVATPHIGGLTPAAIEHQAFDTVRQVTALAAGRLPDHAVNAAQARRLARLGITV